MKLQFGKTKFFFSFLLAPVLASAFVFLFPPSSLQAQIRELSTIQNKFWETSDSGKLWKGVMTGFSYESCPKFNYGQNGQPFNLVSRDICLGIQYALQDRCEELIERDGIRRRDYAYYRVAYETCVGATKAVYKVDCTEERGLEESISRWMRKVSYFDNGLDARIMCEGIKRAITEKQCEDLPLKKKVFCMATLEAKKASSLLRGLAGETLQLGQEGECPVCLEDYKNPEDPSKILPHQELISCGHKICKDCHDSLIRSKENKCPKCRSPLWEEEGRVPFFFADRSQIKMDKGQCVRQTPRGTFLERRPKGECLGLRAP